MEYEEGNVKISPLKREEMKKLIECPVCLDIPLPPIYLCRRGHIVCNYCQERTLVCPLCRDSYTNTRSFVAEGIVEQWELSCKYKDQGCQAKLKGIDLADHLRVCDHRPLRCAECSGSWILFGDYWNHLVGVHQINGCHQSEGEVVYNFDFGGLRDNHQFFVGSMYLWPPYYFKAFGKIFLLKVRGYQNLICTFVCFLGPLEKVKKYGAKIEYCPNAVCATSETFKITWEGAMNHFRVDTMECLIREGRGLMIPVSTIAKNTHPDRDGVQSWCYRLSIFQYDPLESGHNTSTASDEDGNGIILYNSPLNASSEIV